MERKADPAAPAAHSIAANTNPVEPRPLGDSLQIAPGLVVPSSLLRFTYTTSRGPGGQNVNKKSTRCELRLWLRDLPLSAAQAARLADSASHLVTDAGELILSGDEHRTQSRNRDECLDRLRELLIIARRPVKVRKATKPSYGAKQRRLADKKIKGERKENRRRPEE